MTKTNPTMTPGPRLLAWPEQIPKPASAPPLTDAPSDGPKVIRWIEANCRFGEGDKFGQPVRLELFQKISLCWLFELRPDGKRRYRRAFLETPKGNAKALAVDTPIPTPKGWTAMGDLKAGDVVFDERGRQTVVLEAHPVMIGNECYRVQFSDGSEITADAGHLWFTEELRHGYRGSVKTTTDIAASVVVRRDGARNHRIPVAGPLELPNADLPLDPYVLGAWLGDGDSDAGRLTVGDADFPAMLAALAESGMIGERRDCRDRAPRMLLRGIRPVLRRLGVLHDKRIPAAYLRAGYRQRLALLQGLLDTDGSISRDGQVTFAVCRERLAGDVLSLVHTLGIKATVRECDATIGGRVVGRVSRVSFAAPAGVRLFRLGRKQSRVPAARVSSPMSATRMITAVTPVASVPVRCIRVAAASRLFLAGASMIPTHNTPMAAWVAAYLLATQRSAVIPVAAASYEQADLLFGDLRSCVKESPTLAPLFDAFEGEVQVKDGPGRAFKVAAIAGTNDGQRPSAFMADEIHEWSGNKARVHLVIANGCAKRADSLVFNTSTPGADKDSFAGRLHAYGCKVNSGEIVDDEFLFVHWGADPEAHDLDDPAGLEAAIRSANPAADSFVSVPNLLARFRQVPRHEFVRYHLGWWTTVAEAWLPAGAAADCVNPDASPSDGDEVVLGFDGSFNNDSTALVGVSVDEPHHVFVVAAWERPEFAAHDWQVPILDVEEAIRAACKRWQVREIVCDPFRWARTYQVLEGEGLPVVEFPQSPSRMTPATQRFYDSVTSRAITLDGDPRLLRHLDNATVRSDARGSRIAKEHARSTRKIDLAVAAIMALERAAWHAAHPAVPATVPGIFVF